MGWRAGVRGWTGLATAIVLAACSESPSGDAVTANDDLTGLERGQTLAADESAIMIVGTNDIHGSLERFPQFGGYVDAARAHLLDVYGADRSTLLLLDAGDATQGTLLSNFSEGLTAVKAMSAIGYTAAIAGNHGFDFGPAGWKSDQCHASDTSAPCDPLDALRRSVAAANFPFLGANVKKADDHRHVDFLPPATIIPFAGRGIAVIGLENHFTPSTTIPENVAQLTFEDGKEELREQVESLFTSGRADVFVLVMHEGDSQTRSMGAFLSSLPKRSDGAPLIDAAIAGHSHQINDAVAADIPYIQSGANGEMFGVVELVAKKTSPAGRLAIQRERTRKKAAIKIAERPTGFLLEPITVRADVRDVVKAAENEVEAIAKEKLATTPQPITRTNGRTSDSEIGNLIADAMREATRAEIAMINGGDIRDDIASTGDILYEDLFRVIPKNLQLVQVKAMPTMKVVEQLRLAVTSCGRRGALQISGVALVFDRDCDNATFGEDRSAVLRAILSSDDGHAIYQRSDDGTEEVSKPTLHVATTDFVMSGGAGYDRFEGIATTEPALVLRDEVAADLKRRGSLDPSTFKRGRYRPVR